MYTDGDKTIETEDRTKDLVSSDSFSCAALALSQGQMYVRINGVVFRGTGDSYNSLLEH